MESTPKVSVIVPVYNVQAYLQEALSSIVNQTLKEIEVICIDDGSTDRSGSILDEWSEKDQRLKVFHKPNEGFGKAVNTGIAAAKGAYISIIEPDDYTSQDMLGTLYDIAIKYGLDFVKSDFNEVYGDASRRFVRPMRLLGDIELYNKIICPSQSSGVFDGYIMNQTGIYKRRFLIEHDIRLNETPGAAYQDTGFWFQVMSYSERSMFVPKPFYFYRQDNPGSSIASRDKVFCICDEFEFLHRKLRPEAWESLYTRIQYCKFRSYMFALKRIADVYRMDFLVNMQKEFKSSLEANPHTLDDFPERAKNTMMSIINAPKEYYHTINGAFRHIHEVIKEMKEAIIYGAGEVGRQILREMGEEDRNKLLGFAVTELAGNLKEYGGVPVFEIQHYIDKKDSIAVIIGVLPNKSQEILSLLNEKGFKNIVMFDNPDW